MARNMNTLLIVMVLAIATLFHGSAAQTRHVVGDSTGWTIASGGASFYTNWAANKTFTVGDTLFFNFTTGAHDVAKVTKSNFDACSGAGSIFTLNNGPATVTLNETGDQYFICAFQGHCTAGQKLTIKVSQKASTASPAPQPSPVAAPAPAPQASTTPPSPSPTAVPESAPAPAPSSSRAVTYTVLDNLGWIIPNGGASAYVNWAAGKNFKVGDILVFNYQVNTHNVEEVTKEHFDSCSSVSPISKHSNPPVRITLTKSGPHYFICGYTGHCSAGQKLAINVTGAASTAPSPSSTATPPSASTTPSSPSPAGSVSPPPQNSGAASLGSTLGLFATVLSVAAAFFY